LQTSSLTIPEYPFHDYSSSYLNINFPPLFLIIHQYSSFRYCYRHSSYYYSCILFLQTFTPLTIPAHQAPVLVVGRRALRQKCGVSTRQHKQCIVSPRRCVALSALSLAVSTLACISLMPMPHWPYSNLSHWLISMAARARCYVGSITTQKPTLTFCITICQRTLCIFLHTYVSIFAYLCQC